LVAGSHPDCRAVPIQIVALYLSTSGKWVTRHKHAELMSGPHNDKDKELARLRKENRTLREERDILKKATALRPALHPTALVA
jgi:transposase-like protein